MKLVLQRHTFSEMATIGDLSVDGVSFCKTLEDTDRKLECDGIKIPGKTAIPRGMYQVIIDWSPRFKTELPRLLDVPDFTGIRIHAGNKAEDTEGCILVGAHVVNDGFISDSRTTFNRLFDVMDYAYQAGNEITMEVR